MDKTELNIIMRDAIVLADGFVREGQGRVSIHVSNEFIDACRAHITMVPSERAWTSASSTLWGFPLVLEGDWEGMQVRVRCEKVIR